MRICLVSSSFYPATFYGGPISATWDLSKKITNQNIEVFVSTTNANGNKKLNVLKNKFIKQYQNLFVKTSSFLLPLAFVVDTKTSIFRSVSFFDKSQVAEIGPP